MAEEELTHKMAATTSESPQDKWEGLGCGSHDLSGQTPANHHGPT